MRKNPKEIFVSEHSLLAQRIISTTRAQQIPHGLYTTLTEAEVAGLGAAFDLANGHAYHDIPAALRPVIEDLPAIWNYSASRPVPDMEEEFKRSSAEIFGSLALADHRYYSI